MKIATWQLKTHLPCLQIVTHNFTLHTMTLLHLSALHPSCSTLIRSTSIWGIKPSSACLFPCMWWPLPAPINLLARQFFPAVCAGPTLTLCCERERCRAVEKPSHRQQAGLSLLCAPPSHHAQLSKHRGINSPRPSHRGTGFYYSGSAISGREQG